MKESLVRGLASDLDVRIGLLLTNPDREKDFPLANLRELALGSIGVAQYLILYGELTGQFSSSVVNDGQHYQWGPSINNGFSSWTATGDFTVAERQLNRSNAFPMTINDWASANNAVTSLENRLFGL